MNLVRALYRKKIHRMSRLKFCWLSKKSFSYLTNLALLRFTIICYQWITFWFFIGTNLIVRLSSLVFKAHFCQSSSRPFFCYQTLTFHLFPSWDITISRSLFSVHFLTSQTIHFKMVLAWTHFLFQYLKFWKALLHCHC